MNELLNVAVRPAVDDVPRPVECDVGARVAGRERRASDGGEVVLGDAADGPRELTDVAEVVALDYVLRPVAGDEERARRRARCRGGGVGVVREIVVADGAEGPAELVDVSIVAGVDRVL